MNFAEMIQQVFKALNSAAMAISFDTIVAVCPMRIAVLYVDAMLATNMIDEVFWQAATLLFSPATVADYMLHRSSTRHPQFIGVATGVRPEQ